MKWSIKLFNVISSKTESSQYNVISKKVCALFLFQYILQDTKCLIQNQIYFGSKYSSKEMQKGQNLQYKTYVNDGNTCTSSIGSVCP